MAYEYRDVKEMTKEQEAVFKEYKRALRHFADYGEGEDRVVELYNKLESMGTDMYWVDEYDLELAMEGY